MATSEEIRRDQKRYLLLLKMIKENKTTLDQAIVMAETEMQEEDVAYVEKKVKQLK